MLEVTKGIRPLLVIAALALAAPVSHANALEIVGMWGPPAPRSGTNASFIHDFDGDGRSDFAQLVYNGGSRGIEVSTIDPATRQLRQLGAVFWPTQGPGHTATMFVNATGNAEIVVVEYSGIATRVSGWPLRKGAAISTLPYATAARVADLDADGQLELVVVGKPWEYASTFDLAAYTLDGGSRRWLQTGGGGPDLVVAQLDTDPALEIVSGLKVIDGASAAVEYEIPANGYLYGNLTHADVDADGIDELFSVVGGGAVTMYQSGPWSARWSVPSNHYDIGLTTADINSDGRAELAIAYHAFGGIDFFDTISRQIVAHAGGVTTYGSYPSAFGQLDQDAATEMIWWADSTWKISDIAPVSGDISIPEFYGPFTAFARGDVDADGAEEVLVLNTGTSLNPPKTLTVLDRDSHRIEWQNQWQSPEPFFAAALTSLALIQADADPQLEIVLAGSGQSGDSLAFMLDGRTHVVQWVRRGVVQPGLIQQFLDLARVQQDPSLPGDLLVLRRRGQGGVERANVALLRTSNGAEIWSSDDFECGEFVSNQRHMVIERDVAGEARNALVMCEGTLLSIDLIGRRISWTLPTPTYGESVALVDGLIAILGYNRLDAYDAQSRAFKFSMPTPANGRGIAAVPGQPWEAVMTAGGRMYVVDLAAQRLSPASDEIGSQSGKSDRFDISRNQDGSYSVIVGGDGGVFEVTRSAERLHSNGFED